MYKNEEMRAYTKIENPLFSFFEF